MAAETISAPSMMRIWKYASTDGGLEKNLVLHKSEPLPTPSTSQHLIKVIAAGLNPVDYKPAEAPLVGRIAVKKPATPGFDIAGRIVVPAVGSDLKPGQLVYGASSSNPLAGGALAEYVAAPVASICALPPNVSPLTAGGAPVAAVTAYGSLVPHLKTGTRVFINGGSGGVGTYGIQIAKAVGAHVTVSCSGRNAELCRSLGADKVLDYTTRPLLDQLRDVAASQPFQHVVDNVFNDPSLYFQAHTYTTSEAKFVEVASGPNMSFILFALQASILPSFLGGGRRKFVVFVSDIQRGTLEKIADWIARGTIEPVTDRVFAMEDTAQAFARLKTGRATGKVIVNVTGEAE
nr:zinc-type alcohol dehydrogenase-like protein c16a3.02c [Quercus suber]